MGGVELLQDWLDQLKIIGSFTFSPKTKSKKVMKWIVELSQPFWTWPSNNDKIPTDANTTHYKNHQNFAFFTQIKEDKILTLKLN